jgi:predicted nucleic acid-binding protein
VTVAVDTSVAVPLLVRSHHDHADVVRWWNGQEIALSDHALAETYSVLTRLPGDARLCPADAARLLNARFTSPHAPLVQVLPYCGPR